jgi:hypothetical protein
VGGCQKIVEKVNMLVQDISQDTRKDFNTQIKAMN